MTTETSHHSQRPQHPQRRQRRPSRFLGLALDIGLAPAAYYLCLLIGFDNLGCLLAGTAAVTLRAGYLLCTRRSLDLVVGLMLLTNLVSVTAALLTSDARLILLRDPLTTTLIALVFLATCLLPRPALFHLAKRTAGDTEHWDRRIAADPGFRRPFLVLTAVWASALLAEAIARAVLVYELPVQIMAGLSQVIELAVLAPLIAWTMWFRRNQRAKLARPSTTRPQTV